MNVKNKIPKNVKLKTYLVTVLLISVIFAGALTYTIGQPYIGDVSEVWVQPPFHEATYVIGEYNSTFYYAKNGTTGNYDSVSTNASALINNAYGNMSNGGTLVIKAGTYHVMGLNPPSNSCTFGEGTATKLIYSGDDSSEGHMEQDLYEPHNIFYVEDQTNVEIAYFEMDGNQSAFGPYSIAPAHQCNGVKFSNTTYSSVHHCYIHDVMRSGVLVRGVSVAAYPPMYVDVYNCHFDMCNWDSIEYSDASQCSSYNIYSNGTSDVAIGIWECKDMMFYNIIAEGGNRNKGSTDGHNIFSYDGADSDHPTSGITVTASVFTDFDGEGMLFLNDAQNCEISHSQFININKSAIWENGKNCRNNRIIGNSFNNSGIYESGTNVIAIGSTVGYGGWIISGNTINRGANNGAGIWMGSSINNEITNNVVYKTSGRAIWLANTNNTIIESNILIGDFYQTIRLTSKCNNIKILSNTLYNQTSYYGLVFEDTIGTVDIENNIFDNVATPMYGLEYVSDIRFWNNIGYVTENSGKQIVANNENITHGLVSTPVYYTVTCLNETYDSVAVMAWLDYSGIDATNLNVCIYWVNGTAITDDIIYVAWDARTWN